jgi:hypothetical protein
MTRMERLTRKLGLDNNPLRRRTDRIAACLGAGLLAAFLVGAPLLSIAAAHWAGRLAAAEQRAERPWRLVSAVLLRGAPAPPLFAAALYGGTWVPARWTAPDGRVRTGEIDVFSGLPKGQKVGMWVTQTGAPTGPPLAHEAVVARMVIGAAVAPIMLGIVLGFVAAVGRWVFDRRRLARWDSTWASVGPVWTKRFWSRG